MANDNTHHYLYFAAMAADEAYHQALVKVYGSKANEARYYLTHTHPEVIRASKAKLAADEDLRNSWNS